MKENFLDQPLGSFGDEINTIDKATQNENILEGVDKTQTLREFLKKDKTKLRAFLSILKKSETEAAEADISKEVRKIKVIDALDTFIEQYKSGEHTTLEPRQIESLVRILTFLRLGKKRGFLELPTGLGKTVIFSELIEAIKDIPDIKILVVGSGNINAIQNAQKIQAFGDEEAGQYYAGKKDLSARVTICNYHGLRNAVKNSEFDGNEFDLVFLDEVHDGLGEVTQESINKEFKDQVIIGFTATATYELSDRRTVKDFLPVEIDRMPIVEAVEENLLSAFDVEIVELPNPVRSIDVRGGMYDTADLNKKINTEVRNNLVVESYINFYQKKDNRTIAFCVGIKHAKDLSASFLKKGVSAGYLTGESTIDEREAVLQKLKEGTIEVLCGSKLTWQALDETEVSIGLNVAPSLSEKDVVQRGGRVLRRSKVRNNKRAKIVEFLDEWRGTKNRPVFYSEVLQVSSAQPKNWKGEGSDTTNASEAVVHSGSHSELLIDEVIENVREEDDTILEELPELLEVAEEEVPFSDDKVESDKKERVKKIVRHTSAKTVMSISNQNRKFRNEGYFDYAPKGWMSSNIIAVELGVSAREVESAISLLNSQKSTRGKLSPKAYLSALGIKRNFYDPKSVNEIYVYFTKLTRDKKVQDGDIPADVDFEQLEQESLDRKNDAPEANDIDLNWQDYDLTPSFTLEGESLDDELEGVNTDDTSELHPESDSIDGEMGDLFPYGYYTQYGKVYDNKIIDDRAAKVKRIIKAGKVTDRYGLSPNVETENALLESSDNTSSESVLIRSEMEDEILKIIENDLNSRERMVMEQYFFSNNGETLETIGNKIGLTREAIRKIIERAILTIRTKLRIKDSMSELKWTDSEI